MRFSIIIPVYNVEKYLEQCVDSVLNQTFSDFELILVDDGSLDNCPKICDEYAKNNNQISVIYKKNGGASSARNAGILKAQGEYLLFVDSDDYWDDENALLKINQTIEKEKVDIVRFSCKKWYSEENKFILPNMNFSRFVGLNNEETLIKMIDCQELKPAAWTMAIRRDFIIENDLFFKEGMRCEDIEWAIRLFVLLPRFSFLEESFYVYRAKREGSVTATIDYKHLCDYCDIIDSSLEVVKKCEQEIREALTCYIMYHVLIASALTQSTQLKKEERANIHKRLSLVCKMHLKKCSMDKRVKFGKAVYSIFGYGIMSKMVGFYLIHRGR